MPARPPGTHRGRPPRTAEQRADRRAQLVDGAMQAIRALGPEASLIEIASGAGVSKPALYAEFGDKEGLVDAIAQMSGDRIDNAITDGLKDAGPLDERGIVELMVRAAVDFADDDPNVFALVLRGLRNPDRPYATNPIRMRIHGRAMALVDLIASDTNDDERELVTSSLVGGLLSGVEAWEATRALGKEQVVERLTAAIYAALNGLSKKDPAQHSVGAIH